LSFALLAVPLVLAGCAASGDHAGPVARPYTAAPPVAGERDLDRQWSRYEGVHFERPPPPGKPVPRFTFGFGSGTPRQLIYD